MGRPINKKYLGAHASHQIQSTTWGTNDTEAIAGFLTKQNSTNRFRAATIHGSSLTTLANGTPTSAGYSSVKVFPVGTIPTSQATATGNLKVINATIVNGGNVYHANDVLSLNGGVYENAATITVDSVFANSAINAFTLNTVANQGYTSLPSNIAGVSTTDTSNANGTGAIFSINFGLESVNITDGGINYTEAKFTFPNATSSPSVTSTVTNGVIQNSVVVTAPGIINSTPVTINIIGTTGTTEYVKNIQSSKKLITWSGNVYTWLPAGATPSSTWSSENVKLAFLDTL
jgi:hypothetical protein